MEEESFDVIKFKMNSHLQNITTITSGLALDKQKLTEVEDNLKVLDDAKNILTILKNYKMESKKDFILKTINTALTDVFDQNLRVDIEAMSAVSTGKINMKYDIVLYQNNIEMARNEKLLGNNGGGVLSFISILFKILVGYIYSDNKFFLFDESISQVSPLYRPRLAQFLKKFCAEYDFTLVLISQTDDIDEYADVGYLLDGEFNDDGVPILKIDSIFGTYPEDKYTYVKIENFQSIVKLEFRYKGFTVIRGNNNIGKSASFRAVNALLFNTFDVKDHPRKKRPRGAAVRILFGREDSESKIQDNKIGLSYTSNKVVYEFNDKTFAGKSLAFDKVKEKVESIGFKYVDLKETYKNFKGNLKDQTERLAMTTQYDGFYLVGNKNNETEKVFNFLFDSTDVANAISTCVNEINEHNRDLNSLTERIKINHSILEIEKISYEIYIHKFYFYMIVNHISELNTKKRYNNTKVLLQDTIENINGYVMIIQGLNELTKYKSQLSELRRNNAIERFNTINELIEYDTYYKNITSFIKDKNMLNTNYTLRDKNIFKSSTIDNIIKLVSDLKTYRYYTDLFTSYFQLTEKLVDLKKYTSLQKMDIIKLIIDNILFLNNFNLQLNNLQLAKNELIESTTNKQEVIKKLADLEIEYHIRICECCNGTGYIQ